MTCVNELYINALFTGTWSTRRNGPTTGRLPG
jgi:hypothetical protein